MKNTTAEIMIVEDESFVAKDIADCLTNNGYRVSDVFATGEQAIEQVKVAAPSLIFMDIYLQGNINGIETALQIHSISDVPIIFLTAYSDQRFIEQAKETNAFAYLVKPFKDKDLITNLEIALNRYQKEKQYAYQTNEREKVAQMLSQVNDTLEQAKRAKEAFIENISHEVKTPMNGIIGMTELMLNTALDNKQMGYLTTIQNSCLWLNRIITDILEICEMEAAQITVDHHEFNVHQILSQIINMMKIQSDKKGVGLDLTTSDDMPAVVNGDSVRLRQVLVKLIDNAIKFTHQGKIQVNVTPIKATTGEQVLKFSIADTGIGIPEDKIKLIFEKFTRVNTSMTTEFSGIGLGLASAKALVSAMKGDIYVEKANEKGSTFCFEIPFPTEQT